MRLGLCALLVLVVAALPSGAQGGSTHIGCPGNDIHFKASDGTKLLAHRYGKGKTFVVLAHQGQGNLCDWSDGAKRLASIGYSVLAFDFRGFGEAQARTGAAEKRYDRDIVAAVGEARKLGAKKVFVMGASLGGWAAIIGLPQVNPPVAGLVTLSAEPQLIGDSLPSAQKLTVPVLYVISKDEGLTPDSQDMYSATASADKTLKIVPGSAHGVQLLSPIFNKGGWRTVRTLVEAFLQRH